MIIARDVHGLDVYGIEAVAELAVIGDAAGLLIEIADAADAGKWGGYGDYDCHLAEPAAPGRRGRSGAGAADLG